MASRKEQKEALRAERERKAQEAAAAERRRRMIGLGAAGALALAAVAAIVVVLVVSGGGGGNGGAGAEPGAGEFVDAEIPAQGSVSDLDAAARAAGCRVTQGESEGRDHVSEPVEYKSSPPHSGPHNEFAAQDGAYTEAPPMEQMVHSLEHGRVVLWYQPNASAELKGQLKSLFDEDTYHMLLAPNTRDMTAQVAASSWTRTITCDRVTDKTWDALRLFRDRYRDQAPEQVP